MSGDPASLAWPNFDRIKLSLITPRRLLFDIAKAGWEDGVSSSDEEDTPPPSSTAPLATSTLALTKLASTLLLAASQQRVQYLNPTVYFLLPNLPPPSDAEPEVKAFVDELTALGIHVQCGPPTSDGNSVFAPRTIPELVTSLSSPLHRRVTSVTDPINLDTTILLAIISDVSNCTSVEVEHHIHPAIANQLEFEKTEPMLTTHLWPVMEGRDLVCTEVAAKRFWEIVKTMASAKEAERAELLMNRTESGDNLKRFAELCMHPLPEKGLHLPVYVLEEDSLEDSKEEVMKRVGAKLSAVNRGAFMGGWKAGLTTVTSNRAVAKIIASQVHDNEVGPDLYVVESARSLVGKAKKIKV